jgi:hypothetical protein
MTAPAGREHNALQNHHLSSPLGPEDTDSSPDTQQDARSSSANDEEGIRGPKNSQHISGALATERSQFIAPAGDIGYVQRDTNININCKRISERFLARLFLGNWNAIPSHEQPTSPGSTVQLEEYPVQRDVAPQRPLEVVSEAQLAPPPPPPAPPAPPPRKQPRISDQTSLQNQEANAALLIASPGRGWFHDRIQHFKNLPLKTRIIVVLLFIVLLGLIIVGIIVLFLTHVLPLHSSSPLPGTASSSSFAATPGSSPVYSSISATKTGTSTTGLSSLIFTNLDSTVVGVTLALVTSSTSSSSSEPSKPWTTSYIPAASSPTSTCSW